MFILLRVVISFHRTPGIDFADSAGGLVVVAEVTATRFHSVAVDDGLLGDAIVVLRAVHV